MFKIKAKLTGLKEAVASLDGLKKSLRNKILRKAVNGATQIVLRAVKAAETMRRSGQLRRSLGRKVKTYPSGVVLGIVGPRKGYRVLWERRPIDPTKYAHLVERGVKPHAVGKGSRLRKKVQTGATHPGFQGIHFLERGWESSRAAAEEKAAGLIAAGIAAEAAKLAKAA